MPNLVYCSILFFCKRKWFIYCINNKKQVFVIIRYFSNLSLLWSFNHLSSCCVVLGWHCVSVNEMLNNMVQYCVSVNQIFNTVNVVLHCVVVGVFFVCFFLQLIMLLISMQMGLTAVP